MKISFPAWLKSFVVGAITIAMGSALMIIWSFVIINPFVICRLFIYNPFVFIMVGVIYAANNTKLRKQDEYFVRNNAVGGGIAALSVGIVGFIMDTSIKIYNNYLTAKYAEYSLREAMEKLPFLDVEILMVACYFVLVFVGSVIGGISAWMYSKRLQKI